MNRCSDLLNGEESTIPRNTIGARNVADGSQFDYDYNDIIAMSEKHCDKYI